MTVCVESLIKARLRFYLDPAWPSFFLLSSLKPAILHLRIVWLVPWRNCATVSLILMTLISLVKSGLVPQDCSGESSKPFKIRVSLEQDGTQRWASMHRRSNPSPSPFSAALAVHCERCRGGQPPQNASDSRHTTGGDGCRLGFRFRISVWKSCLPC